MGKHLRWIQLAAQWAMRKPTGHSRNLYILNLWSDYLTSEITRGQITIFKIKLDVAHKRQKHPTQLSRGPAWSTGFWIYRQCLMEENSPLERLICRQEPKRTGSTWWLSHLRWGDSIPTYCQRRTWQRKWTYRFRTFVKQWKYISPY